jgi:hypothetical protein
MYSVPHHSLWLHLRWPVLLLCETFLARVSFFESLEISSVEKALLKPLRFIGSFAIAFELHQWFSLFLDMIKFPIPFLIS